MAKIVKKKKKKLGGRGFSSGAGPQTSSLRPKHVPKSPPCQYGCPNNNDIRGWITTLAQTEGFKRTEDESYKLAWELAVETSPFPAVCGRVCPHPCESECNRQKLEGPVGINAIERAIGDFGIKHNLPLPMLTDEKHPEKIAVIGAGPGGLSCAYQLARRGYSVTIFEALAKTGGMLRYGIPNYRLPEDVLDAEVQKILDLGVELKLNTRIGSDIKFEDLKNDFKAVFVSIGAHKGYDLRVEGEDAPNVITGTKFLNIINSGEQFDVGKRVMVIGGGDTAIDAARVSMRLGADVTIVYRRTVSEMPAIAPEIVEAKEEGINFEFLSAPISFKKEGDRAVGMTCIRMELGEPDASGRPRPIPIEGSEFFIEADTVIKAISQQPDFDGLDMLKEGKSWIKVNDKFEAETPFENVWAGGDNVQLALAITAIAHGRRAAEFIYDNLTGEEHEKLKLKDKILADKMKLEFYEKSQRNDIAHAPVEERIKSLDMEVSNGFTPEQAMSEAKRCMSCGQCFYCETCWMLCTPGAIKKSYEYGNLYEFKLDLCDGCKKCADECPSGFIEMF